MAGSVRRVVTGHDPNGKSVVLSDGPPPQHHAMHGPGVGADFFEIWNTPDPVPQLTSVPHAEPNARDFTIIRRPGICCGSSRSIRPRTAASGR